MECCKKSKVLTEPKVDIYCSVAKRDTSGAGRILGNEERIWEEAESLFYCFIYILPLIIDLLLKCRSIAAFLQIRCWLKCYQ
jgi:hypothetical protein